MNVWVDLMSKLFFKNYFLIFKYLIKPASYSRSLHDSTYAYLRSLNKTTEKFGYLTKDLARNGTLINNMSKGVFSGKY